MQFSLAGDNLNSLRERDDTSEVGAASTYQSSTPARPPVVAPQHNFVSPVLPLFTPVQSNDNRIDNSSLARPESLQRTNDLVDSVENVQQSWRETASQHYISLDCDQLDVNSDGKASVSYSSTPVSRGILKYSPVSCSTSVASVRQSRRSRRLNGSSTKRVSFPGSRVAIGRRTAQKFPMASRSLYRSVLSSNQSHCSNGYSVINGSNPNIINGSNGGNNNNNRMESPMVPRKKFSMDFSPVMNLSPVSSLAVDFNSANLSEVGGVSTPCRRLSLSSSVSSDGTPLSCVSFSSLSSNSYPPERKKKRFTNLSCSLSESIEQSATAILGVYSMLPSPTSPCANVSDDKENGRPHTTPKDKSVSSLRLYGRRRSPLKDIGNVSRSLCFASPAKKAVTPAKKQRKPQEPTCDTSPPDEPDASSRDSGYSESATKSEDGRLGETVSCTPRKLNLDTPTKVKFGRFQSLSTFHRPNSLQSVVVLPLTTQTSVSNISPDSLLSQNSNFPTSSLEATTSTTSLTSSAASKFECFKLTSLLTQSNVVLEQDEDFYNDGLYSMDEYSEDCSSPELGKLLSGPVMDISMSSVCSDAAECTPSSTETDTILPSTDTTLPSTDTTRPSTNTTRPSTDTTRPSTDTTRPSTDTTLPSTDTTRPSTDTTLSLDDTIVQSAIASPKTPQMPSNNNDRKSRRVTLLACNMEVSPFNPQPRGFIRRTLSLFDSTPPPSGQQGKNIMSSNCAFKRPLPPTESSPFLDTKRHKAAAIGGTPLISGAVRCSANGQLGEKPPPMLSIADLSPSIPVIIPQPLSPHLQSDASPELVCSKLCPSTEMRPDEAVCNGESFNISTVEPLPKVQSSYNLVPRQYSAPVAVLGCLTNSNTDKEPMSRALSESHLSIMKALNKSQNREEELTGDFAQALCLPVVIGRHPDIKSIGPDTLAGLMRGDYEDTVASFQLLDCRYPYEYAGGHIYGAESWHIPQFVVDQVETAHSECNQPDLAKDTGRHVLIFHCEFSAERGPRAQRLLRERDRTVNKDNYPSLHYPETYLLEGGYKAFFERYPELCIPKKYTKMIDPNHADDLKFCRAKSKTWAAENKQAKGRTGLRSKKYSRT